MSIVDTITEHFKKELPFVVYRKPNEAKVSGIFQKTNALRYVDKYDEPGFVFAPFDPSLPSVLIPTAISETISERLSVAIDESNDVNYKSLDNSEERHLKLVAKTIQEIKKTGIKKIVISRKEELQLQEVDCCTIFLKLLATYSSAMVYLWYHPKVGIWIGATPESLLNLEGRSFSTMSLAATRPYKDTLDVNWNSKEIEEQSLVTDFIKTALNEVSENYMVHPKETIRAGNVVHIKTLLTGEIKNEEKGLIDLIAMLHPTPAVCGMPRDSAMKFILSEEGYNRSYYTGFLGEVLKEGVTELYVNLRCMEIKGNTAIVYVGGGITAHSIPAEEWAETKLKTKTLKQVL